MFRGRNGTVLTTYIWLVNIISSTYSSLTIEFLKGWSETKGEAGVLVRAQNEGLNQSIFSLDFFTLVFSVRLPFQVKNWITGKLHQLSLFPVFSRGAIIKRTKKLNTRLFTFWPEYDCHSVSLPRSSIILLVAFFLYSDAVRRRYTHNIRSFINNWEMKRASWYFHIILCCIIFLQSFPMKWWETV